MLGFLKDFFVEHQATEEDALRKAEQVGWTLEKSDDGGCIVHGTYADNRPATWQYELGQERDMHALLDHVNSLKIGDEYRRQKWGLAPGETDTSDEWSERKQEIREYSTSAYYGEEYKPGWKRFFGL